MTIVTPLWSRTSLPELNSAACSVASCVTWYHRHLEPESSRTPANARQLQHHPDPEFAKPASITTTMSRFAPHKPTANNPRATSSTFCQKCLQRGHFTYQCKNARPYVSRPSRTQLLHKPNALAQLKEEGMSNIDVPEEFLKKCAYPLFSICVCN